MAPGLAPFRGIAAGTGLACVILIAACIILLFEGRSDLTYRSDQMAANILVLAEQSVEIEIGRYDIRMQDIITSLQHAGASGGASPSPDDLFGGVGERGSTGDIMIVDSSGKLLISSRPDITTAYAGILPQVLATTRFDALGRGISSVVNARPHLPELALVRRFSVGGAAGGRRAIVAMLPMSWIQGVFSQIELGRQGVIGLLDSNHLLLARKPLLVDRICTSVWQSQDFQIAPPGEILRMYERSRIDGVFRRISASRVGDTPLFVFVGLATQDTYRRWSEVAVVLFTSITFLAAVIIALTAAVLRQLRRKARTDQQLIALNAQLAELARTDQLTGLLNRRGFDENLAREWRRCRRAGKPLSLLMLDADFFKHYNDHFGHQAGDAVLQRIAGCIEQTIRRPGHIAARYGGEEFAVVLPDTNLPDAVDVAERIRGLSCGQCD